MLNFEVGHILNKSFNIQNSKKTRNVEQGMLNFEIVLVESTIALAQIAEESFWLKNAIFCWCKKATNGSCFMPYKKSIVCQNL
jgi:hypothetical protein